MSSNSRIPELGFTLRHRLAVQKRFSDIDVLGHVNNNACLSYFDLGKTHYFLDALPPSDSNMHNVEAVIVNINVSFHAPTYFHEPIEVLTGVASVSEHSFVMEQRIVNADTGEVKATARSIMAGFDMSTASSMAISEEWTDAMERWEGRKLRNQGAVRP